MSQNEYFLITGQKRSGTTLLANFLNGQQGYLCIADYLRTVIRKGLETPTTSMEVNRIRSALQPEILRDFAFDISQVGLKGENRSDLYKYILSEISSRTGRDASILGVKVTCLEPLIQELIESNIKTIYMYRDPRDVVLSKKNRFENFNLARAVVEWKTSIKDAFRHEDNDRFLKLRFEDLILNPEKRLGIVSTFLGKNIDASANPEYRATGAELYNSSFGDVQSSFSKKALNRWKEEQDSFDNKFVSTICSSQMRALGYDPDISVGERIGVYFSKDYVSYVVRSLKLKTFSILRVLKKAVVGIDD